MIKDLIEFKNSIIEFIFEFLGIIILIGLIGIMFIIIFFLISMILNKSIGLL